jgi:diadenosine tetraphosphate (Ap4A) HIT family hydrolase
MDQIDSFVPPKTNQMLQQSMVSTAYEEDKEDYEVDAKKVNQTDFFYRIKDYNPEKKVYLIEIPKLKKKYKV